MRTQRWFLSWFVAALAVIFFTLFQVARVQAQTLDPAVNLPISAPATTEPATGSALPSFLSDEAVTVTDSTGPAFVVGGRVTQNGQVGGDLVVLGGTVHISGTVEQDVYAMAGTVIVDGTIQGNLVVMAGEVQILPWATVEGSVISLAETLVQDGTVLGELRFMGRELEWNGSVANDAWIRAERLSLHGEAQAATVRGRVVTLEQAETVTFSGDMSVVVEPAPADQPTDPKAFARALAFTVINAALVAWLVWLISRHLWTDLAPRVRADWGQPLTFGLIVGFIWPVLGMGLLLTGGGIPLAVAGTFFWMLALWLGWIVLACLVAEELPKRWPRLPRWAAVLITGAIWGAVISLPLIGWILRVLSGLFGLGVVLWSLRPVTQPDKKLISARPKKAK